MRQIIFKLVLLGSSLLLVLGAAELVLRVFPEFLPPGHYGAGVFDENLQLNVHGSTAIYNKVRFVVRKPNSLGFMDDEHEEEKRAGRVRIGFFGDSYVESIQVPIEKTFFKGLASRLPSGVVEPFSFGISGWGTLHSMMAYDVLGDRFDLDVVVYVFVANDAGDNSFTVQSVQKGRSTPKPSAVLIDRKPGFDLRWPVNPDALPLHYRIPKWFQRHSLLLKFVYSRIQLIRIQGATGADTPRPDRPPKLNQNLAPSLWPPDALTEARSLTKRLLDRFSKSVEADGRHFFVLYVPRGNAEITGELPERDRWLPWLREVTDELGVTMLNPLPAFVTAASDGVDMYDDHWSPAGHQVIADFLERELCERVPKLGCGSAKTR